MKPYNKLIAIWATGIVVWSFFLSYIKDFGFTAFDWVILFIIPAVLIFYTVGWIKDYRNKRK